MGQKVHPTGIRLGITKVASSTWYPDNASFASTLSSDREIREFIKKRLPQGSSISDIFIERRGEKSVSIKIKTAKPGVVIGKKGSDIEVIRSELAKKLNADVHIGIEEIRKPELESVLVAESIAGQLERRIMFRRAMKRAVTNALRAGAKGIKVAVSGRLGGAEIARTEWYREGRVPLHTFRADIDYGTAEAKTTYGIIGVKVWIFKGEIIGSETQEKPADAATV